MTNYEKIRADVSKHFKSEIENLKLEVLRLNKENADLQVENAVLKNDVQKYKNRLNAWRIGHMQRMDFSLRI